MGIYEEDFFVDNEKIDIYEINPLNTPMNLLLMADPSFNSINSYIKASRVLVARKKSAIIGLIVFLKRTQEEYEVMNLAVEENNRGKGIAKRFLKAGDSKMVPLGAKKLIIGTRNSSIEKLGLYQRFGFRISEIEKDYYCAKCKEKIWENGILCRDRIIFEKKY